MISVNYTPRYSIDYIYISFFSESKSCTVLKLLPKIIPGQIQNVLNSCRYLFDVYLLKMQLQARASSLLRLLVTAWVANVNNCPNPLNWMTPQSQKRGSPYLHWRTSNLQIRNSLMKHSPDSVTSRLLRFEAS